MNRIEKLAVSAMCWMLKKKYLDRGLSVYRFSNVIRRKATSDGKVQEIEREKVHVETRTIESISYERVGFLKFTFYLNASLPNRIPAEAEPQAPLPFATRGARTPKDIRSFNVAHVKPSFVVPGDFFIIP